MIDTAVVVPGTGTLDPPKLSDLATSCLQAPSLCSGRIFHQNQARREPKLKEKNNVTLNPKTNKKEDSYRKLMELTTLIKGKQGEFKGETAYE